jgi:hypothetical protein
MWDFLAADIDDDIAEPEFINPESSCRSVDNNVIFISTNFGREGSQFVEW